MVQLKKAGKKIRLLPSQKEERTCLKCGGNFDTNRRQRACFDLCSHESCLECIFKMNNGCDQCNLTKEKHNASKTLLSPQANLNGGNQSTGLIEEIDDNSELDEEDGIIVISSVLRKPDREKNKDAFPEIRSLSLSTLPVLECMSTVGTPVHLGPQLEDEDMTPLVITLDDDDVDENEVIYVEQFPKQIDVPEDFREIVELNSSQIESIKNVEQDDDDDIQEVPVDEYTRLAGEDEDEEEEVDQENYDVQSTTSHVTVIDPFHFSDDDENNPGQSEPTPRNLRKRRFSQLTAQSIEEDDDEDEELDENENMGNYETTLNKKHRKKRLSQSTENSDNETLNEEIRRRELGKYICRHCGIRFIKRVLLARHLAQNHGERRPFSCNLCDWPFHSQRNLENHMLTHTNERPFKCSHCEGAFNRKFTLDNHLQKMHGILATKRVKGQRSSTVVRRQSNQNEEEVLTPSFIQEDNVIIPSIESTRSQPDEKLTNFNKAISQISYQEEGPVPSPASSVSDEQKENRQVDRKTALLEQIYKRMPKKVKGGQIKNKRLKCRQCEMTFERKYCLDRHVRIAHLNKSKRNGQLRVKNFEKYDKKHVCNICATSFKNKRQLIAHSKKHLKLKCTICELQNFGSLEEHLNERHGIRTRSKEEMLEKDNGNGGNYCPECQSLFGQDNEKGLNEKVWYSECGHLSCIDCVIKADGLGCGQCTTERVRMEDFLGNFFEEIEENEKRKILEVKVVLTRLEDEKEKKWRNLEEAVKIKEKEEMVESFKTITKSNGSRTFYCPYCKREFREKRILGLHLQDMHKEKRPFACDICQWPFSSGKDLERHRIIHTNDKPFRCNLCPVTFNRKSIRDRHVEKVHLKWRRI